MASAYGCCSHQRLDEVLFSYLPYADAELLQDRRCTHVLHTGAVGGDIQLLLTAGALMGVSSAPDGFRMVFQKPINVCRQWPPQPQLLDKCPRVPDPV
eukprot:9456577-Pyramimonas_sp.AAC.1